MWLSIKFCISDCYSECRPCFWICVVLSHHIQAHFSGEFLQILADYESYASDPNAICRVRLRSCRHCLNGEKDCASEMLQANSPTRARTSSQLQKTNLEELKVCPALLTNQADAVLSSIDKANYNLQVGICYLFQQACVGVAVAWCARPLVITLNLWVFVVMASAIHHDNRRLCKVCQHNTAVGNNYGLLKLDYQLLLKMACQCYLTSRAVHIAWWTLRCHLFHNLLILKSKLCHWRHCFDVIFAHSCCISTSLSAQSCHVHGPVQVVSRPVYLFSCQTSI